jgi:uncharacterized phiE125 gp8 family phage protein
MTLIQTTPPTLEFVSLAEAKAHLRLDTTADDLLVAALITAARQHIEKFLQIALISQSWSLFLDAWPDASAPITLPIGPVIQLTAVRTFAPDDTPTFHTISGFELDRGPPPRIALRNRSVLTSTRRRLNSIEIAFTAGFGASPSDVPQSIRQAVLHLTTQLYEHRGFSADEAQMSAIEPLLAPWRTQRLI